MMRHLKIRILVALIAFALGIGLSRWTSQWTSRQADSRVTQVQTEDDETLIFEGTVLRIGPPVPASGQFAFYRLAKYRVERVHYGHYESSEIVVDHLSLTTRELDGLNEGDRVCVQARRSKTIFMRTNVSGIREESENVDTFYIGGDVSK